MSPQARKIRLFVVALSLFVFLLALNAKLSVYDSPAQANATSTSKLWLNGQKMEGQAQMVLVIAVLAVAFLPLSMRFPRSPWAKVQLREPIRYQVPVFEFDRFVRPPPVL